MDDEPSIRDFLAFILTDEGFCVETACDGQQALDLARRSPPDVLLTDLMMPGVDGYGLIDGIRAQHIPVRAIIAMSAIWTAAERTPDADLFLAKPFEIDEVLASVQALLAGE
ncbi:MAG: response regulator transcription factor [Dehalococcoidia bacterium]